MREVAELITDWLVTTTAMLLVLRWDERRMTPEQRARAWPTTTRLSVAFGLGYPCLSVHFVRTRERLSGILTGAVLAAVIYELGGLAASGVGALFGGAE